MTRSIKVSCMSFTPHMMFAAALLFVSVPLHATPIDLSIPIPDRIGAPGDTVTFEGTVTNNTEDALSSTDLFLNFSGFDPVNVTLNQLVGLTSFSIPGGSTSPLVDLFTFALSPTALPGTYSAGVVLQTAGGDVSGLQVVRLTDVPEPGSFALLGTAALALLVSGLRRRAKLVLPTILVMVTASQLTWAQVSAVQFVTGSPGIGTSGSTLMLAIPITNNGTADAANVQVTGATLSTAPVVAPGIFPVGLGTIAPQGSATFEPSFEASALSPNVPYLLTVRGTYQVGAATAGFTVNRFVTVPPASPGLGATKTATVDANFVSGAPYAPQLPQFDAEVNGARPPIPTGPFVPGTPTPVGTGALQSPANSGVSAQLSPAAAQILFPVNNGLGITSAGTNCNPGVAPASCAEPSGATGGGVVFVTANWTAAYSTDGGTNFTQIDPTTIFPADAIGFCCDQIVQYVPTIDRFHLASARQRDADRFGQSRPDHQ